jgi:hypothetical protein
VSPAFTDVGAVTDAPDATVAAFTYACDAARNATGDDGCDAVTDPVTGTLLTPRSSVTVNEYV